MRNLAARWLGQIVVIISGFIIPRQIDGSLGSESLGIWDFGWSTVNYFRLFGFGLAGGLNRFVALYHAEDESQKLQRAVSSTVFMTIIISIAVLATAALVAKFLPLLFDEGQTHDIGQSQVLILFLGATVAYRMLCWPARSILTGFHLTTVTSMVTAAGDLFLLTGLVGVLHFGGGLGQLGAVVLVTSLLTETTRVFMARRVYDGPILARALLDRKMMGKLFAFGMKNNLGGLPSIVVIQTTSVILASIAGPSALAVFSRPLALCNIIGTLVRQYAMLLTPVTGGMQGLKRFDDIREFFLTSLRTSIAMTLPPLLLLGAYGDIVVEFWMNEDYVVEWLCPLLALAFFLSISQSAALRILAGVNAHGRVAIRSILISTLVSAIALSWVLTDELNVISAAIVVGLGMSAGPGLVVMIGACRRFEVGVFEYLRTSMLPPILCNIPLMAVVLASRALNPGLSLLEAALWACAGGLVVVSCYWRFLLSETMRDDLATRIFKFARK